MIALPFSGRLNVIRATRSVTSKVIVFSLVRSTSLRIDVIPYADQGVGVLAGDGAIP